jgi:glycosyltransferase involved in cell wall biosynthesis
MASHGELSIVIPVFNEAAGLAELIGKIHALEPAATEVIVVDDGSGDGSGEIALKAGAKVIRHPFNFGNGATVKSGLRAAQGKSIVLKDGNCQHKPDARDLLRFIDLLLNIFSYPTTLTLAFLRSGLPVKYVPIQTLYRSGRSK